ncbi:hypothetical protein ABI063_14950, partial [Enterococcus faecium]|uniref:hypothetical protein n=1 Tax=Enterococcus faecium TaxID=1352 RepID=UPI003F424342
PISRPLQENNLSSQLALGMSTVIILGLHWSGAKVATHLVQANVGKVVLIDADEKALIDAQHSLEPVIVSSRSKTQL